MLPANPRHISEPEDISLGQAGDGQVPQVIQILISAQHAHAETEPGVLKTSPGGIIIMIYDAFPDQCGGNPQCFEALGLQQHLNNFFVFPHQQDFLNTVIFFHLGF